MCLLALPVLKQAGESHVSLRGLSLTVVILL